MLLPRYIICFDFISGSKLVCANDKRPHRCDALPFPAKGRVELAYQFPEGLILGATPFWTFFSPRFLSLLFTEASQMDGVFNSKSLPTFFIYLPNRSLYSLFQLKPFFLFTFPIAAIYFHASSH